MYQPRTIRSRERHAGGRRRSQARVWLLALSGCGACGVGTEQEAAVTTAGSAGGKMAPEVFATGDAYVSDVRVNVHEKVNTVLVVTWEQTMAADQSWLEFSFAGASSMTSRPISGSPGPRRDVILGVPGATEVSFRIVHDVGGVLHETRRYHGRTEPVPLGMPQPEVLSYTPELASTERWLIGAVEDSAGGVGSGYYRGTFWLYIMDRDGRIVWYYADPASNASTSFQRRARDGQYLVFEKRCYGCGNYAESIVKMSLDWQLFEELPVNGLSDCIDVTDDGSLLYDANDELRELSPDGDVRSIWSCRAHFGDEFDCYTNTVNYNPRSNTVLLSYPVRGTVVEVDRQSGDLVGQYGNAPDSYGFAPPKASPPEAWSFGYPHFPIYTQAGTLLLSSHMPGYEDTTEPVAYQHAFLEFEVDHENRQLIERWRYTEGPEWAFAKGMALRLANGNTLANYGTGGVIREITPAKETAWHVKFDVPDGDDFYNKMVGHNELIDDLYSLNGGFE